MQYTVTEQKDLTLITSDALQLEDVTKKVTLPHCGAISVFIGK